MPSLELGLFEQWRGCVYVACHATPQSFICRCACCNPTLVLWWLRVSIAVSAAFVTHVSRRWCAVLWGATCPLRAHSPHNGMARHGATALSIHTLIHTYTHYIYVRYLYFYTPIPPMAHMCSMLFAQGPCNVKQQRRGDTYLPPGWASVRMAGPAIQCCAGSAFPRWSSWAEWGGGFVGRLLLFAELSGAWLPISATPRQPAAVQDTTAHSSACTRTCAWHWVACAVCHLCDVLADGQQLCRP